MELSADNVTTVFRGCAVWTTGLDQEIDEAGRPGGEVQVDGIMHRFHLHKRSVAARREDIAQCWPSRRRSSERTPAEGGRS